MKKVNGSCHCGAVRYAAEVDLEAGTGKCNCTFCAKARNWSMMVKPAAFELLAGDGELGGYSFNTHSAQHHFCQKCGVRVYTHGNIPELGGEFYSVQVSTFDDVTPEELLAAPMRYSDGLHNNWWEEPKVKAHL